MRTFKISLEIWENAVTFAVRLKHPWFLRLKERCPSGLRSTPGKCVYAKSVSGVRIPVSPPRSAEIPLWILAGLLIVLVLCSTERWQSWFNVPDSKSGVPSRVPGVRIPLSPPKNFQRLCRNLISTEALFLCLMRIIGYSFFD